MSRSMSNHTAMRNDVQQAWEAGGRGSFLCHETVFCFVLFCFYENFILNHIKLTAVVK